MAAYAPVIGLEPVIISYLRFSSPEQEWGDSERRQLEALERYAAKQNIPISDEFRFADHGISAFSGKHRSGNLGKILELARSGQVPPGSILVVENTDRLSREDTLTAFDTISAIIRAGITIHTVMPEADYTLASLNGGQIYFLIAQIQLAHQESAKKSERIRAARDQARKLARANGTLLTSLVPAWLSAVGPKGEQRLEVIPEAADTIRLIFELKLQGLSKSALEAHLNKHAPWQRPNGWRDSYICKILNNRAVLGEYQPHIKRDGKRTPEGEPIPDYFPRIIDNEAFFAVQARLAARKGQGGRTGKVSNLFTHIVRCAYCGGPMRYVDKGKPPKCGKYLVCDRAVRKVGCERHPVRYAEFERTILEFGYKLKPEQVLPNQDTQQKLCDTLRRLIAGKTAEQADLNQQIENLTDQIAHTKSQASRDRYQLRITQMEERLEAINTEVDQAKRDLQAAEQASASLANWQANLQTLCKELDKGDPILRMRVRAHLKEFITKIEVFGVGHKRDMPIGDDDSDYEDIDEYLETVADEAWPNGFPSKRDSGKFWAFAAWVKQQRMSSKGQFYRIHWKQFGTPQPEKTSSGRLKVRVPGKCRGILDAVPPSSIASGTRIVREDGGLTRHFVEPDLDALWKKFKKRGRAS